MHRVFPILMAVTGVFAQYECKLEGSSWTLKNDMPFDAVFYLIAHKPEGTSSHKVLSLAGATRQTLKWDASYQLEIKDVMYVHPQLSQNAPENVAYLENVQPQFGLIPSVDAAVDEATVSDSRAAEEFVNLKQNADYLKGKAWQERVQHQYQDPFYDKQFELTMKTEGIAAAQQQQFDQSVSQTMEMQMGLAASTMETLNDQQLMWGQDADRLKDILDQLKASENDLKTHLKRLERASESGADFGESVQKHYRTVPLKPQRPGQASRVYTHKQPLSKDLVRIVAATGHRATGPMKILVDFDRGGKFQTMAIPSKDLRGWIATLYWPTEATSAEVKAHNGNTWRSCGSIQTGRVSYTRLAKDIKKKAKDVKKRYQKLKWLSEGGSGQGSGLAIY